MSSVLFEPFRLHDLTLPNRIVLAPMTRGRAGSARLPNRLMAEYYSQRSSAGCSSPRPPRSPRRPTAGTSRRASIPTIGGRTSLALAAKDASHEAHHFLLST
jgi:2,4-dienoyl-CoA reductase-like NADH-dependent reductase (Old Yellow Enzyme family)